jgi:hypothetical protein
MKKSKFTEVQIAFILRQTGEQTPVPVVCRSSRVAAIVLSIRQVSTPPRAYRYSSPAGLQMMVFYAFRLATT